MALRYRKAEALKCQAGSAYGMGANQIGGGVAGCTIASAITSREIMISHMYENKLAKFRRQRPSTCHRRAAA